MATDSTEPQPLTQLNHYRLLGDSGLRVSPLSLGTMGFGDAWAWMGSGKSKESCEAIFNQYVDAGGNFIDTANVYQDGASETFLGEFIAKRGNRDNLVLATKYSLPVPRGEINHAGNHRKNMFQALEKSLERLRTHYVDIYYVHFWDFATPNKEIMRGLDDLVRSGKVHYIGISDAPAWEVATCNTLAGFHGWSQFICYQGRYSIINRDVERDILPMCRKLGLGFIGWGVAGGGKLSGKYRRGQPAPVTGEGRQGLTISEQEYDVIEEVVAISQEVKRTPTQVVHNWALQQPGTASLLLGARTPEQLKDSLDSLSFTLSKDQLARLEKVSAIDMGFPHSFLGGHSYKTNPWLKGAGVIA